MNSENNNNRIFALIYLVLAVLSLLRGILSFLSGAPVTALVRIILGIIFLTVFFIYRKKYS